MRRSRSKVGLANAGMLAANGLLTPVAASHVAGPAKHPRTRASRMRARAVLLGHLLYAG
jgi:hypothetical protein